MLYEGSMGVIRVFIIKSQGVWIDFEGGEGLWKGYNRGEMRFEICFRRIFGSQYGERIGGREIGFRKREDSNLGMGIGKNRKGQRIEGKRIYCDFLKKVVCIGD